MRRNRARTHWASAGLLRRRHGRHADLLAPRAAAGRLCRRAEHYRGVWFDDRHHAWLAGPRGRLRQLAGGEAGEDPVTSTHTTGEALVDPIVLEIVEGTLASAEAEVEAAIERTARSPMIREARDFRGGIHDRHCRKLTGRSYSALVQPIVRDFPIETIQPGDVFFHNDVYLSEG